jgi:hypothetical protein
VAVWAADAAQTAFTNAYVADEGNSRFSLLVSQATPVALNFRRIQCVFTQPGAFSTAHEGLQSADSVEEVELTARLNSGTTIGGESTHYIECFLGASLTFAALLLG